MPWAATYPRPSRFRSDCSALRSRRFTVVTYGSEGDTRPLVALCRGLMDRGHEVCLFGERSTQASARAHGVPFEALDGDLKSILPLAEPERELRGRDYWRALRQSSKLINGSTVAWMKRVTAHAVGADAMLIAGLAWPMARVVADQLRKPTIALWLQPNSPTRDFPSPALPFMRLPGWLNRLSYRASPEAVVRLLYGHAAESARRELFGRENRSPDRTYPILYGFSRCLVRRPVDWPDSAQICGHWPLASEGWLPPPELSEFLAAGPPPVYVGFGAVSSFFRRAGLRDIAAAVQDRRALFFPGWSHITAAMLPKNFFVVGDTPHAWLFPRTSLVIHHGGGGTTHTAARAGVPQIPLPVAADQFFWSDRVALAGVAPRTLRAATLSAPALSALIEFAEGEEVRRRAKALGAAMALESGVDVAVSAIETQIGG